MKCKYCGKNLIEGAKYCVYCAKPVEDEPDEETIKNTKENNQAILGVIIVVTIIAIIVGSIFVYKRFVSNSKKQSSNNNNNVVQEPVESKKSEIPNITKDEAKKLVDTYYFITTGPDKNLFTVPVDENVKKIITLRSVENNIKTIDCTQLENFVKTENDICVKIDDKNSFTKGRTIDYDTFNNQYKYLFGKTNELAKENIKDLNNITTWEYNASKNLFLETYIISGLEGNPYYSTYVVKEFIQNENMLTIKVGYVYMHGGFDMDPILETEIAGEKVLYKESETKTYTFEEEFLNKYLDKLDTYVLTFKYEDDHYVFESISKE